LKKAKKTGETRKNGDKKREKERKRGANAAPQKRYRRGRRRRGKEG